MTQSDDIILQTSGLTKVFDGFVAVEDVCLNVRRRSIHAVIGPNGAGKTTLFNLLTKVTQPTRGKILFEGEDVTTLTSHDLARRGMVRSFQISAIFPALSVLENVRIALQGRHGHLFDFWRSKSALNRLNDEARGYLGQVGLEREEDAVAGDLSYGRRRALEIATTLAMEPSLLLLDEPTAGMGREDVERIGDLIKRCAAERTVIMVEHNLGLVSRLADTITVQVRGRTVAEGDYDTVSRDPTVRQAYLGQDDA